MDFKKLILSTDSVQYDNVQLAGQQRADIVTSFLGILGCHRTCHSLCVAGLGFMGEALEVKGLS